ncbi:hypothetical protein LNAOJCKE_2572 [Methylorubrum aminovorans]|uniref:Uncharacterized protein n=1 Tax=Methylorubrum aminovorans TaxID=269069 RepID=A0ABQ4UF91_9HYPH|nr:hypothetical protein LNAOJCKE_2572 [Methylorubrum aminovorans]
MTRLLTPFTGHLQEPPGGTARAGCATVGDMPFDMGGGCD